MKYSLYFIHRLGRFGSTFLFCQSPHLFSAQAHSHHEANANPSNKFVVEFSEFWFFWIFHYIAVPAVMCVSSDSNNSTKTEFHKTKKRQLKYFLFVLRLSERSNDSIMYGELCARAHCAHSCSDDTQNIRRNSELNKFKWHVSSNGTYAHWSLCILCTFTVFA